MLVSLFQEPQALDVLSAKDLEGDLIRNLVSSTFSLGLLKITESC